MANIRTTIIASALFLLAVPVAQANDGIRTVDCNAGDTIAKALRKAKPGNTILVSGTCNENVDVPADLQQVTLDGQGTATINGPDAALSTVEIRGTDIVIKGFTLTGGRHGLFVVSGGTARLDGNIVQNVGEDGIQVRLGASAIIVNNTVQNNPGEGINVGEGASVRVGFRESRGFRVAEPNVIQNNAGRGISVTRASSARIYSNRILTNGGGGVRVSRGAYADVSSNDISGNVGDGILVQQTSAVVLGADTTEDPVADDPNSTTANNTGFGIRCTVGGSLDGRIGTLKGTAGVLSSATSCANSLIP